MKQPKLPLFVALCMAGAAFAQQPAQPGAPATPPAAGQPAAGPAQAAQANTPYAIGAQRNGVAKCINRINQVTTFLTNNTANSGLVFNSPTGQTNQRLTSTVMEVQAQAPGQPQPQGPLSFVSASFAPGAAEGECGATYDAVTYWPVVCEQVFKTSFANFKVAKPLRANIFTLDGGPLVKVFLMPAGAQGCVSIKKEVLY